MLSRLTKPKSLCETFHTLVLCPMACVCVYEEDHVRWGDIMVYVFICLIGAVLAGIKA